MSHHSAWLTIVCGFLFVVSPFSADSKETLSDLGSMTTSDLLSLRQIGGESGTLSVSPDGGHVAFQLRSANVAARRHDAHYDLEWFVKRIGDKSEPIRVGDGGEVMLNGGPFGRVNGSIADVKPLWSPDGQWIAYLKRLDGQVQVWRAHVGGLREEQVTHNAADVVSFEWSPDGRSIRFEVGRTRAAMESVRRDEGKVGYLLDDRYAPTYSTEPLWFTCGSGLWGIAPPTREQCSLTAWIKELSSSGTELRAPADRADSLSGADAKKEATELAGDAKSGLVWSGDHRHSAWLENENPTEYRGFAAPLTLFSTSGRCVAPECRGHISKLWWSRNQIVFHRNEGYADGTIALYAWAPGDRKTRPIYRVEGVLASCELARSSLICLEETAVSPRRIVAVDISTGAINTVVEPNPAFGAGVTNIVEKLEWKDAFGNETFGHLVYPSGYAPSRRYPLVIVQYRSRGFLDGGVGNEYPIYPLAAKNFFVLSFDRPEDRSIEARYPIANLAQLGEFVSQQWKDGYAQRQALSALETIVERLAARGLIDSTRVGITGLSNGAETVDFALANSKHFAAAAVSGNVSPELYYFEANESLRALFRAMFDAATGREAIERWKSLSMVHNVEKVSTPLLIQVSDRELVPALPAYVAFKEAGVPVEAYVFPGEYHVKWQPGHKLSVGERTIDWFEFWLKNEEDPSPEKEEQYARWRKLRDSYLQSRKLTHN